MKEEKDFHAVFFAGGESRDNKFNVFTGNFIRFLSNIMEENFTLIKGIYFRYPMFNVIWTLNNAQKPLKNPEKNKITSAAFKQIVNNRNKSESVLIILSSSSGSIVAAQTACYLAQENIRHNYFNKPFHVVLGTNIISKESDLYLTLLNYREKGIIGTIIFDELQDEEDSINGTGGKTRADAWANAFGLMFPIFSRKFKSPSFLNTNHEKGHFHRIRSQTVKKAVDFIEVIFIRNKLAGEFYKERAIAILKCEK
jgi:hypothetical protein